MESRRVDKGPQGPYLRHMQDRDWNTGLQATLYSDHREACEADQSTFPFERQ
jgi:hypothetical protein